MTSTGNPPSESETATERASPTESSSRRDERTSRTSSPRGRRRPRLRRALPTVISLVAVIAVVIFATGSDGGSSVADSSFIPEAERVKAPTAPAPLLTGDGERSLTAYRGKVTVLNFWASWCGPCRAEQPELNAAHDKLGNRDVAFLGVDLQDSRTNGQAHWREFDVPYDSLFDRSNSWSARFDGVGPAAIPTTIVLDREGRVAARLFGQTTEGEVLGVTTRILEER